MICKSVKKSAAAVVAVIAAAVFAAIFCTGCTKSPTGGGENGDTETDSTYVVTFDANGGSGTPPSAKTVIRGFSTTLPNGSGLTRDGYNFGGWNTESGGNGTNYGVGSSYTPTSDITLYAKWYVPGEVVYGASVTYGGETYKTVVIGNQTWFASNLNYDVPNDTTDKCFSDSAEYCEVYGRMYSWNTAQTICPTGSHLPTDGEWLDLMNFVGEPAGTKLKAASGWVAGASGDFFGATDDFGFSALPGGRKGGSQGWRDIGSRANWWAASEGVPNINGVAYSLRSSDEIYWRFDNNPKSDLHSVRCLMD